MVGLKDWTKLYWACQGKTGPVAFENLIPEAKEKIMLSCFIGETEVIDVFEGRR